MINFIKQIFCKHNLKKVKCITVVDELERPIDYIYVFICPKCGYTKKIHIK